MKRLVAKCCVVLLAVVGLAAPAAPALASEGSESGVNIGFAMSWSVGASPIGSSASFLQNDGETLNNCGGGELANPDYQGCSFLFETELDGQVADSFMDLANHPFGTIEPYDEANDDSICGQSPPFFVLTNFNCFNENSYGQIFRPTGSGSLTNFQMAITCLATETISIWAVLYELEAGVESTVPFTPPVSFPKITGSPLGSYEITLDNCATSWQNKTFSSADFEIVDMDFGDPQLTAGTSYGVYFAGEFVPGAQIIDVATLDSSGDVERTSDVVRPYDGPVISSYPAGSSRPGGPAVFSGQNLSSISSVVVDGQECSFQIVNGELVVTLPTNLAPGSYDLNITSNFGNLTVQSALVITGVAEGSSGAGTKRTGDSFRIYYFDPVNKGKVQFFLNGEEIAWVSTTTDSDPKLRSTTKDGIDTSYLVRTLDLVSGKNVVEVFVDGERVKRVAYTLG